MKHAWNCIYRRLRADFAQPEARRLTNLALAGALAAEQSTGMLDSFQLVDFANRVSDELAESKSFSKETFGGLAGLRLDLDTHNLDRASLDDWVEAFQATDGSRKSLGAFSTPAPFAAVLATQALLAKKAEAISRVVDPSAGAGALLISMLHALIRRNVEPARAAAMLHGVEIDPVARELCVLHIWLSVPLSVRPPLGHIAKNVLLDDSISRNWWVNCAPYDVVITNPPWESLRHSRANEKDERVRLETLACLETKKGGAPGLPPLYSAHGRGDRNLFKAFVELFPHLLTDQGVVSALVPAAFGSDLGMADLRRFYFKCLSIERWTTFENQSRLFPIDSRYKFGIMLAKKNWAAPRESM